MSFKVIVWRSRMKWKKSFFFGHLGAVASNYVNTFHPNHLLISAITCPCNCTVTVVQHDGIITSDLNKTHQGPKMYLYTKSMRFWTFNQTAQINSSSVSYLVSLWLPSPQGSIRLISCSTFLHSVADYCLPLKKVVCSLQITQLQQQQFSIISITYSHFSISQKLVQFMTLNWIHLCCWELGSADCPSLWRRDQQVTWRVVGLICTPETRLYQTKRKQS